MRLPAQDRKPGIRTLQRLPPWTKYTHACLKQASGNGAPVPTATWATHLISSSLVSFLAKWKHQRQPCSPQMESSLLASDDVIVIKRLQKLEKSSPYARDWYYYCINSRAFPEEPLRARHLCEALGTWRPTRSLSAAQEASTMRRRRTDQQWPAVGGGLGQREASGLQERK